MRKSTALILVASALIAHGEFVSARGPGGGGGAPHFGGPAPASQAASNSNGRFASDRETGLDRAMDRMSEQGKTHEKATDQTKKSDKDARDAKRATPAAPAPR